MALYSATLGTASNNVSAATPAADLKASANNSPRLFECSVNQGAAGTLSLWGLGRPANDGSVVQTSTTAPLSENPNDPTAQSTLALTWTTAPTAPTTFVRRGYTPAVIGAGIIWSFPRGLLLKASCGAVLWNINANSATVSTGFVIDE